MSQYFDFAEYYDYDHNFSFDLAFYHDFAAQCQSPILELACGTGRLTIPLAEAGFDITGLDNSVAMLQRCRTAVEKRDLADRVQLTLADMAAFDLSQKAFGLAFIALRSFMHLLSRSEQRDCLRCVYNHLQPGGLLIIDVIAPDLAKLSQKADLAFFVRREFDLPNRNRVVRQIRLLEHDRINQVRHFEFKFEEYDTAGLLLREQHVSVSTRYIFRFELELLLEAAGFEIVDVFRDYEKKLYDGTGEMIAVAQCKRSR